MVIYLGGWSATRDFKRLSGCPVISIVKLARTAKDPTRRCGYEGNNDELAKKVSVRFYFPIVRVHVAIGVACLGISSQAEPSRR